MILDKQEFNKLDIREKSEYINNMLAKGKSLGNISNDLGIIKTTIHDGFIEHCYIFNKEARQYIKNNEYKENINILNDANINKYKK
ncbi:MAG: hypothetical protein ACI8WT_005006 [Clostridium sp.]|jgi:hypothetical protein